MVAIEFHTSAQLQGTIPHPFPASRHIPDWFKDMPPDCNDGGTLKRCPPFLAAMSAGYIIPAPDDSRLIMSPDGVLSATATRLNYLSTHFPSQYKGSPFAAVRVVKFMNPWVIVTPPDYVCLITAPLNRFDIPFTPLTGIVETGSFYREVNLPMACALGPGQDYRLARGTPMIQVIPIRRDEFAASIGVTDTARYAEQEAMFNASPHYYKDNFWQKLTFT